MNIDEIKKRYLDIDSRIDEFGSVTPEIKKIISRGYVCCNNDDVRSQGVAILLTGINPSNKKKEDDCPHVVNDFSFKEATKNKCRFWTKKRAQFGDLTDSMSYFDLFPIRVSKQDEGFEKTFKNANDIRGRFLEVTQKAIEDMAPKLIVHANRASMYYWGIKKYGRGENSEFPWMGYTLERVTRNNTPSLPACCCEKRLEYFPLYRITGFVDSEKRINNDVLKTTNLTYLMEYVMEYRNPKYIPRLYKSEEWREIWNWLNSSKYLPF